MSEISRLPSSLQPLARRIDSGATGPTAHDGSVSLEELSAARQKNVFAANELGAAAELEKLLLQDTGGAAPLGGTGFSLGRTTGDTQALDVSGITLNPGQALELAGVDPSRAVAYVDAKTTDGRDVSVRVGRDAQRNRADGSSSNWGFQQPTFGPVTIEGSGKLDHVNVHYAPKGEVGFSDYYSIPVGKDGIKHGQAMELPIPENRRGMGIENIDVSFHAPVRDWNRQTGREQKPTYVDWYTDSTSLGRKFVDPNVDNGNSPEIDNVHGENANGTSVLAPAGKTLRIVADNPHIPGNEDAMTVQWVRVTYRPQNAAVQEFHFKGAQLPNSEWKGKWLQPGEPLALDVDPTKKISRVEVQWSDKPDDVGFEEPGKWATGSLRLDGKPLGVQNEHVGSPEWQFFDNLRGAQGKKLEIVGADSPLKIYEVKVYYES